MTRIKPFQWTAVLMLAIAVAPSTASAQEDGTITISSTFTMDWLDGTVGSDLAEVFANGHEHTWTLTLDGTPQSHYKSGFFTMNYVTEIHATSFALEFFGPDAATLNGIVRDHIAGGDVRIYLQNAYSLGFGDDFAVWDVSVSGPDVEFWTGLLDYASFTLFPSDADGYPVVGPDPFSIWAEDHILIDNRPGNDGWMGSGGGLVTISSPLPGDFNGDNVVDAADYVLWRNNNIDGESGYNDWRANFGATAAGAAAVAHSTTSAIPEPAAIGLILIAAWGLTLPRSLRPIHSYRRINLR